MDNHSVSVFGMEINATITKRVNEEISSLRIPHTALAERAGIAYSTLTRRLKGRGDWTATEIAGVAHALRISPGAIITEAFAGDSAVAA